MCDPTGTRNSCADGPGASYTCVRLNEFYGASTAPDTLGTCIDCTVWGSTYPAPCP